MGNLRPYLKWMGPKRNPVFVVLYPLTHDDQIRHGNTWGVSGMSRHCLCTNASRVRVCQQ